MIENKYLDWILKRRQRCIWNDESAVKWTVLKTVLQLLKSRKKPPSKCSRRRRFFKKRCGSSWDSWLLILKTVSSLFKLRCSRDMNRWSRVSCLGFSKETMLLLGCSFLFKSKTSQVSSCNHQIQTKNRTSWEHNENEKEIDEGLTHSWIFKVSGSSETSSREQSSNLGL